MKDHQSSVKDQRPKITYTILIRLCEYSHGNHSPGRSNYVHGNNSHGVVKLNLFTLQLLTWIFPVQCLLEFSQDSEIQLKWDNDYLPSVHQWIGEKGEKCSDYSDYKRMPRDNAETRCWRDQRSTMDPKKGRTDPWWIPVKQADRRSACLPTKSSFILQIRTLLE